jgi:4-methyl-5(b-hydroxyethyl)-thiazole monophosphate biosynthesis
MVPSVLVVLAHGFEEVEAIVPIDLIRRSGAKVTVAGLGDMTIRGAHNISLACDVALEDCASTPYDCIILPGGGLGSENLAASPLVMTKIVEVAQSGIVAAICAAPAVVLGHTGLLDGKRVTGFPSTEDLCEGLVFTGAGVEVDGNIITAQAAGSAVDFALAIIAALLGQEQADAIAEQIYYPGK